MWACVVQAGPPSLGAWLLTQHKVITHQGHLQAVRSHREQQQEDVRLRVQTHVVRKSAGIAGHVAHWQQE